jgi:hypothetical protein
LITSELVDTEIASDYHLKKISDTIGGGFHRVIAALPRR